MEGQSSPDHVQEEWFEQYVLGVLPEAQAAILEERLLFDENCRLRLDQTENYIRAMRGALRRAQTELAEPAASPWHWRSWRVWPVAATAAVAMAALVLTVTQIYRPAGALGPVSETIALDASRGGAGGATAHPGHLQLRLDLRGIPERSAPRVQVVTERGQEVWSAPLRISGDFTTVDVRRKLEAGQYLVRVQAGGEQLREFPLAVQ